MRRLPPLLTLTLAAACAQDAAPPPGDLTTVVDSADVRIVDLGAAPLDIVDRRAVAPEPDLVIRSREDDASSVLSDVRDVEVLPQGRVAVVNGSGNEILAIPPAGGSVHPIGTWPGGELAMFRHDGLLDVTQPPFGRRLYIVPAPDGLWIADDDRWEARKYSARGELRMVVRSSASSAAVTDELLEAFISERYRDAVEGPALEDMKQDQREIARHTTTPSFDRIVGTTDGGVAVREFGVGTASPRIWITVQPSGTAAAIELPAGLAVKRWGPDWVIGIVRDELDREEIHRYRILAGAGPGS